ncbi:S1C family serine protease [Microbacterium sp. E-13]|uniref:S1C family serine protease n=1 Tax=Microbacterium sp. E-13 TaxID=3404048 RepID=UPI003CF6B192
MSTSQPRRAAITLAVVAVSGVALSACMSPVTPVEAKSRAVGFDDLQTATVYIKGQGTFIDPGTLDPAEGRWIGSGFIVSEDGLVLTNNHVVTGAGTLNVFVGGDEGKEVRATVLGASECLDLAVIQLSGEGYPFLAWHEGDIATGLDVYSAGYPMGAAEQFTLTRGIVSKDDFPLDTQWAALDHVIEHDARIRGGNSGGPLVDEKGRLVGVNYAGDDSLDYNFAIHRDVAKEAVADLAAGKNVDSLGINAKGWVSEDGSVAGVWVSSVDAGGPADRAGIEPGDLVYKLAGVSVGGDGTLAEYCQVLRTQGADATVDLQVYRPSTDQLLDGQINGQELAVTASNVFGGETAEAGGFTDVTDDSGVLSVSVPADWSQVDGEGFTTDDGSPWYAVTAAPDLAAFWGGYEGAGVQLMAADEAGRSVEDVLSTVSSTFEDACSAVATGEPYDDGWYAGVYSEWSCGASTSAVALSTADDAGNNVVLIIQLASDYDKQEALPQILATFQAAL